MPSMKKIPELFVLVMLLAIPTHAQKTHLPEPLTFETWQSLSSDKSLETCLTTECNVLKKIILSFEQLDERDFPNSQTMDVDKPEKRQTELPIVTFVKFSEEAKQQTCRILVSIVRNVNDSATVFHALEIATLVEKYCDGCIREVVSATPNKIEGIVVLKDAFDLCKSRDEPNCDQLQKVSSK